MNYHELKKDAKIVDEILLYLLKNNDDDISIDISRNEDKIIFTFKISKLSKEALSYMDKYINKEREIDSIEIQINDDVITYLMKDRLPKEQGNLSFLHLLGMNCVNVKIVI